MNNKWIVAATKLITGCRARWLDSPNDTSPRIYFSNHSSHLDSLVIWASLPSATRDRCRMVAARDYWSAGPIRRYIALNVFNVVLIERHQVRKSCNPIDDMCRVLDEGCSLIVFPEGSRQTGTEIAPFQSGIFHLCRRRPELQFVPVYLENLNRILPKAEFLPVPFISSVTFGRPLQFEPGVTKDAFLTSARNAVERLRGNHAGI